MDLFEHRQEPLVPTHVFLRRLARHGGLAFGIVLFSLLVGMVGYHSLEGIPWIDALLNSSMLLGGMGPVTELHTVPGKLFASFYALYAGLVFLIVASILFVPVFHRFLHRFHLSSDDDDGDDDDTEKTKS